MNEDQKKELAKIKELRKLRRVAGNTIFVNNFIDNAKDYSIPQHKINRVDNPSLTASQKANEVEKLLQQSIQEISQTETVSTEADSTEDAVVEAAGQEEDSEREVEEIEEGVGEPEAEKEASNAYEEFGLDKNATQKEIDDAYRDKLKNASDEEVEKLQKAYGNIWTEEDRADYDQYLLELEQTTETEIPPGVEVLVGTTTSIPQSTSPPPVTGGPSSSSIARTRSMGKLQRSFLKLGVQRLSKEDPDAALAYLLYLEGGILGKDFAKKVATSDVLTELQRERLLGVANLADAIQDEFAKDKEKLVKQRSELNRRISIRRRQIEKGQKELSNQFEIIVHEGQVRRSLFTVNFVQTQPPDTPGVPIYSGQSFQIPSFSFPGSDQLTGWARGKVGGWARGKLGGLAKGQLKKLSSKAATKLGLKTMGKMGVKAVGKLGLKVAASAVATPLAALAIEAIDLGIKVGKKAVKVGRKAVKYAAALGLALLLGLSGAFSVIIGQALVIVLVVFPVLVAIILFIINTGAFVVPYGPEVGGSLDGGGDNGGASGSCPVKNHDTEFYQLSYEASTEKGHGSNGYYKAIWGSESDPSSWPCTKLPVAGGCQSPNVPGSELNECKLRNIYASCSQYGYALDMFPTTDLGVYLPDISDSWDYKYTIPNSHGNGWGVVYSGGKYNILLLHLNENMTKGNNLKAGTRIGSLFDQSYIDNDGNKRDNTHAHIELTVNGVSKKPENYMCGFVSTGDGDEDGWLIKSKYHDTSFGDFTLRASPPSEYKQDTCTMAINIMGEAGDVNYATAVSIQEPPLGHAGYKFADPPHFTFNGSISIPWRTFAVEGAPYNVRMFDQGVDPVNPSLLISGVQFGNAIAPTTRMPRTTFGLLDNDQVIVSVLKNATSEEAEQVILNEGVDPDNIMHLAIGAAAQLCSSPSFQVAERIFPQSNFTNPINSFGFAGNIEEIYLDDGGGPNSCEDPVEIDTGSNDSKLFSSSEVNIPEAKTVSALNIALQEINAYIPSDEKSPKTARLYILDSCQGGVYKKLYDDMIARGISGMTINSKPDDIKDYFSSCMPNCMFIRSSELGNSKNFLERLILHESRHMVQGYNNPNFGKDYWLNDVPNGTATSYAAFLEAVADDGPNLDGNIMEGSYYPCRIDYLKSLPELTDDSIYQAGLGKINYYNEIVAIYNASYESTMSFDELFLINFRRSAQCP